VFSGLGVAPVDGEPVQHILSVLVEGEANEEGYAPRVNFNINEDTVRLFDAIPEVGTTVTGFYNALMPMTMIYPPNHNAVVFAVQGTGGIMVDRFDEQFLSSDGSMFIHISDNVTITLQDGTAFEGSHNDLIGRALVIEYGHMMYSFPAQATPARIIVLFERAVHPIHYFTEEELAMLDGDGFIQPDSSWQGGLLLTEEDLDIFWSNMIDPETVQVFVNGEPVNMPTPFVNREAGAVMVPVAYIAEALGYPVIGEGEELIIGRGSIITVGVDSYHYNRMASVALGAAPELHDGVVFVPLHFFGNVFPYGAFIQDGDIFVQSEMFEADGGIEIAPADPLDSTDE